MAEKFGYFSILSQHVKHKSQIVQPLHDKKDMLVEKVNLIHFFYLLLQNIKGNTLKICKNVSKIMGIILLFLSISRIQDMVESPSSRGQGHRLLMAATGVRFP